VESWVSHSVRGRPLMRQMRAHEWGTRQVHSSGTPVRPRLVCVGPFGPWGWGGLAVVFPTHDDETVMNGPPKVFASKRPA